MARSVNHSASAIGTHPVWAQNCWTGGGEPFGSLSLSGFPVHVAHHTEDAERGALHGR